MANHAAQVQTDSIYWYCSHLTRLLLSFFVALRRLSFLFSPSSSLLPLCWRFGALQQPPLSVQPAFGTFRQHARTLCPECFLRSREHTHFHASEETAMTQTWQPRLWLRFLVFFTFHAASAQLAFRVLQQPLVQFFCRLILDRQLSPTRAHSLHTRRLLRSSSSFCENINPHVFTGGNTHLFSSCFRHMYHMPSLCHFVWLLLPYFVAKSVGSCRDASKQASTGAQSSTFADHGIAGCFHGVPRCCKRLIG